MTARPFLMTSERKNAFAHLEQLSVMPIWCLCWCKWLNRDLIMHVYELMSSRGCETLEGWFEYLIMHVYYTLVADNSSKGMI